jgi:RHS repeat-associated protein
MRMTRKLKVGRKDHSDKLTQYRPRKGWIRLLRGFSFWADQTVLDDKLIGQQYYNSQNPTPNVSFSYNDPLGRLTSMTDGTGTHLYSYIDFGEAGGGQLEKIIQPVGNTAATITYAYNNDGAVTLRSIDGVNETYGFTNDQLTNVTNSLGSFTYTYDQNSSHLVNEAYPNGQATTYTYFTPSDPLGSGRLKEIINSLSGGQTILSKFGYTYNPGGDIKTWMQQLSTNPADAVTYTMGYDQGSQLQGVTLTSGTSGFDNMTTGQFVTYGYDTAGNRTAEQTPDFLHTFGTNNMNQLTSFTSVPIHVKGATNRAAAVTVNGQGVTQIDNFMFEADIQPVTGTSTPLTIRAVASDGTVTTTKKYVLNTVPFQYDENGNLLTDGENNYFWDAENRLIRIKLISTQLGDKPDIIEFTYNGNNERVRIVEKNHENVLSDKSFLWLGGALIEERSAAGSEIKKRFFNHGVQVISEPNAGMFFYSTDHLNSIREVTDTSASIRARYDYDPWGRQSKRSGDLEVDFGYTDIFTNHTTSFGLTLRRIYNTEMGRWFSREPLGEEEDYSLYRYVKNNPVNYKDPSGLSKLYFNYCGPDWTGGLKEQYDPSHESKYKKPCNHQDECCKEHDKCYYRCRKRFCGKDNCKAQAKCFKDCDRLLAICSVEDMKTAIPALVQYMSTSDPKCE